MDHATLVRLIHETLEHLHSRSYLSTHPLATLLGGEFPASADVVRQTLLDAIELLKPEAETSLYEADRRQYRQLILRYVEGQSLERIARELSISTRQASRDHQQALGTLARIIEAKIRERRLGSRFSAVSEPSGPLLLGGMPDLTDEAVKVAACEDPNSDVVQCLNGALGLVEALAATRAVTFVPLLGGALPPVAIGPTLLRQALLNLLVYTCEVVPGTEVILAATDTARGVTLRITCRQGERIGSSRSTGGYTADADRALQAAQQLLETQGGQIELPANVSASLLVRVILPPVPLCQVLLVDDNPEIANLFRRYLLHEPYRVIQAISGPRAIDLARRLHPSAIILDVMIPAQDGWEILQFLRTDPETREVPIIICSVLPERTLALSLGVDDFLPKPVSRSALLDTLRRWCLAPIGRRGQFSPSA